MEDFLCISLSLSVCVCVCEREREREREGDWGEGVCYFLFFYCSSNVSSHSFPNEGSVNMVETIKPIRQIEKKNSFYFISFIYLFI